MHWETRLEALGVGYLGGNGGLREGRPTLVMIHGAGGNAQVWQNQVVLLDETMNVLALDLPGHGSSRGEAQSTISGYARWLAELLKEVTVDRVFLMGHSMGGAIAQEVAITAPHILRGLILVGTGAQLKVAPRFLEGLSEDFEKTVGTFVGYAYSLETDRSLVEEGVRRMKAAGADVVRNDFLACDGFDRRDQLDRIHKPTLVLCGREDKLTPPRLAEALRDGIAESLLQTIPGAGHMIMIERHRELNEAVQAFVNRTLSSH